jgi:uncharacterized membrane protein
MKILSRYDLWLCAALLWGATFCAAFGITAFLRLPLGLVAVLFVPGYLVQVAIFPQAFEISPFARLGYSFGLSLALMLLIGLSLNFTAGLSPLYLLMAVTAVGMLVIWAAWWRRANLAEETPLSPAQSPAPSRSSGTVLAIMLLCVGELALVVLFLLVVTPAATNLTEFYILEPTTRQAENLPVLAKNGETVNVVLGILNREGQTHEYRVEVLVNGQPSGTAGGWRINPNGKLEVSFAFTPKVTGLNVPVLFRLYRTGDTTPHRTLRLILPAIT